VKTFTQLAEDWERTYSAKGGRLEAQTEQMPEDDPAEWVSDFLRWKRERCASRPDKDDSTFISALLLDFSEWCANHQSVPATRQTFEVLLDLEGYHIKNGVASGIVLTKYLWQSRL